MQPLFKVMVLCAGITFCLHAATDTIGIVELKPDSLAAAAAVTYGTLTVYTTPAEANIVCDSVQHGTSPCTFDSLTAGPHVLIIKKRGYFAKKVSVDIMAGESTTVNFTLAKPQRFRIESNPPGAAVELDNKAVGKTPFEDAALKNGRHSYKISLADYAAVNDSLVLGADTTIKVVLVRSNDYVAAQKKESDSRTLTSLLVTGGIFLAFIAILAIVDITQP